MFAGSCDPQGRPGFVYAHALAGSWEDKEPQKVQCHSSEVSCLALAHDGSRLFSAGDDGSLCVFDVADVDAQGRVRAREAKESSDYTEEILVTRSDLEESASSAAALRAKVDELVLNNEYQLRLKDTKYKERLTETAEKFTSELRADAARYEALMDEKRKTEVGYEQTLRSLEDRHKAEFRDLELQSGAGAFFFLLSEPIRRPAAAPPRPRLRRARS